MSSRLPASPSLEQLQRRAKELLRDVRAGDPAATQRLQERHPHPRDVPVLADAQLVIAREHGFAGWAQLRAYVERVAAHGPDLQHAYRDDLDYHRERASGLLASATDASPGAVAAFARWDEPLTEAGARAVVAREHGFATWAAFGRHVRSLRASGEPFAQAFDAVEARDLRAAGRAARPLARAGRPARHERQRPAGDGRRHGRCAHRPAAARARRRPGPRQRARLDAAAPGGVQRPRRPGGAAARSRRPDRHLRSRRRRHAARDRAVLGPSGAPRTGRPDRARTGQPARRRRARADRHDRRPGRARRYARSRRRSAPRLLPAARRLPVLEADRRPAGGAGRGACRGPRVPTGPRRSPCSWNAARTSRPTSTAARR